jgi:hypothetical protein
LTIPGSVSSINRAFASLYLFDFAGLTLCPGTRSRVSPRLFVLRARALC